jgi:hypothetical protein
LVISDHVPASQGVIYAIHLHSKFSPHLGQSASPWDNRLFGAIGEVVANGNPVTVNLPATAFTRQYGGKLFRV